MDLIDSLQIALVNPDQNKLTTWLDQRLVSQGPESLSNYPDVCSYLISWLHYPRKKDVALRLGDAAYELLEKSVSRKAFLNHGTEWHWHVLFLLSCLPVTDREGLVTLTDKQLDQTDLRSRPSDDQDCHRQLLLVLGGHQDPRPDMDGYWASKLERDLVNPTYVAAAFSALIRQAPYDAAEQLPIVLKLMRSSDIPTALVQEKFNRRHSSSKK